jgi:hypothetical protein
MRLKQANIKYCGRISELLCFLYFKFASGVLIYREYNLLPLITLKNYLCKKLLMKKYFGVFLLIAFLFGFQTQSDGQGLNIPAPSPLQKIIQNFATSKISIEYSRPGVKGRSIFGELVPYDSVWRTGANAPTKITFGEEVQLEGKNVPAGIYALYMMPGKEQWTMILSKDTALWGAFGYKAGNDLMRVQLKPTTLPMSMETMTFLFSNVKPTACDVQLLWDKTMVSFHVTTEIDAKIMTQIDQAMKGEKPPYWQAANYYFENGKDINKAYEWVNKAIAARPDAYFMMTAKAKMELKMGKTAEAITTAKQAMELARKENDNNYIAQNEKIIAEASAKK